MCLLMTCFNTVLIGYHFLKMLHTYSGREVIFSETSKLSLSVFAFMNLDSINILPLTSRCYNSKARLKLLASCFWAIYIVSTIIITMSYRRNTLQNHHFLKIFWIFRIGFQNLEKNFVETFSGEITAISKYSNLK